MNQELLKTLQCSKCSSKNWKFEGYNTDSRFVDGTLFCDENHQFTIRQDVARLDKEKSSEDMVFLDHELTGYPKQIAENERNEFLISLETALKNLKFASNSIIVQGNPILFFRFIPKFDNLVLVIDENEGILRQVQNQIVQKQMFHNASFIRGSGILMEGVQRIYFLIEDIKVQEKNGDIIFSITQTPDEGSDILWKSQNYYFTKRIV